MEDLKISIKGEITSSNFESWKSTIIQRIDATPTKLLTDEDFAHADGTVKSYKLIEKRLDEVKQSALDQSRDITNLFNAIDEVKSRVRDVRLQLGRQVTQKKKEIRLRLIDDAISKVRKAINDRNGVFPLLDHSDILNEWDFESAIKGKSSLVRAEAALWQLVKGKLKDIEARVTQVLFNEAQIEKVSEEYSFLFHDKKSLLLKPSDKLVTLIQERVDEYKKQEVVKRDAERRKQEEEATKLEAERQRNEDEAKREVERKRQDAAVGGTQDNEDEKTTPAIAGTLNTPTLVHPTYTAETDTVTTDTRHIGRIITDLKTLANGLNPITGQRLPESSVMNQIDSVRLLYQIIEELEKSPSTD